MIIGVIVALIVLYIIFTYNSLIKSKIRVKEAWADIDVQLKRRYDLIPNLVETVKGYATHEEGVLTKIAELRSKAMQSTGKAKMDVENEISDTLKSLFAVVENYPQLKANENFLELQKELTDTEDKILAARRFYNGVVRDYNIKIAVFPQNLIASILGFKSEPLFEAKEEERENVKVKF